MSNVFMENDDKVLQGEVAVGDIIVGTSGVIGVVAGNGLQINSYNGIGGIQWTSPDAGSICAVIDYDGVLKNAIEGHDASYSYTGDEGQVHFCSDGALVVKAELPCNNSFFVLTDENDPVKSCDKAMQILENIKDKINSLQERVFELSLSQKIDQK